MHLGEKFKIHLRCTLLWHILCMYRKIILAFHIERHCFPRNYIFLEVRNNYFLFLRKCFLSFLSIINHSGYLKFNLVRISSDADHIRFNFLYKSGK